MPCDTCVRRGKSCQYAANADRNPSGPRDASRGSLSNRLKNLENLVLSLAGEGARPDVTSTASTSSAGQDKLAGEVALLATPPQPSMPTGSPVCINGISLRSSASTVHRGQTGVYVDPSHWSCLLEDIRQIRDELSPSWSGGQEPTLLPESSRDVSMEPSPKEGFQAGEGLVFGPFGTLELQHILRSLPSRQLCDRLVSQYFRARHAVLRKLCHETCSSALSTRDQTDFRTAIIHPAKFQQEYASFWEAPGSTNPIWVGLLFATLSVAASVSELSSTTHGSEHTVPSTMSLSKCTEQCLVLGKYATAREYSLEVLLVHLQSCYFRCQDSDLNLWFLMGIIIRLALKLGYHRDPSKLSSPKLSPFDSEMRRRVWATIFQIDTLMSFQMGLPSMLPEQYCDAGLPRNLENSDFDPDTSMLPQARPLTDSTPILYTIVKSSIMSMFRAVISHTRSLTPASYHETMSLDAQLRCAYGNVPAALKYRPISQSIIDSPGTIMDRATIEILHLKSIIVLHRQYITARRLDALFDSSRSACLQAAETVLHRQVEMHGATQPDGQLHDHRWMVSALTTNDFILAAMVICLEMTIRTHQPPGIGSEEARSIRSATQDAESARYLDILRRCQEIWAAAAETSVEAHMASDAIGSTMRRVIACKEAHPRLQAPRLEHSPPSQDATAHYWSPSQRQLPVLDDEAVYIDWVSFL